MKKTVLILMLLMGLSFSLQAETMWYKAYKFNYHMKDTQTGKWDAWSAWERCNLDVEIDTDEQVVVIYSDKKQVYNIVEYVDDYSDKKGGYQAKMKIVDQDGDRGELRLRVDKKGVLQIYIDFADVTWVYCVKD